MGLVELKLKSSVDECDNMVLHPCNLQRSLTNGNGEDKIERKELPREKGGGGGSECLTAPSAEMVSQFRPAFGMNPVP